MDLECILKLKFYHTGSTRQISEIKWAGMDYLPIFFEKWRKKMHKIKIIFNLMTVSTMSAVKKTQKSVS